MPRRLSVDDRLDMLETAADEADSGSLAALLGDALGDRHYRIVALAAHLAAERLVYDCVPKLQSVYPRFLDNPAKRDPNCYAKKAIVRALHELDCDDVDFYLAALRYRQMEPVWGGTVDTATDLRCSAAFGLVSSGYPRALVELAELLADPEAPVRSGAARAIACGNPREAELLLRLKALTGDEDPLVIADCFAGLLSVEPDESPSFVARFLDTDDDAVFESAALALGESRLPRALESLQSAWDGVLVPAERRRMLVRAAVLHRSDESFDWLLTLARNGNAGMAAEIVQSLAIYRHNARLAERIREVVDCREDPEVSARYEQAWQYNENEQRS